MVLVGAWLAGEVLVLSLYSQDVLGYSPLVAGLIAIPQGVGGLVRGLVAAPLLERIGLRWFLAGKWLLAATGTAPPAIAWSWCAGRASRWRRPS
jgi:hypothetical protein